MIIPNLIWKYIVHLKFLTQQNAHRGNRFRIKNVRAFIGSNGAWVRKGWWAWLSNSRHKYCHSPAICILIWDLCRTCIRVWSKIYYNNTILWQAPGSRGSPGKKSRGARQHPLEFWWTPKRFKILPKRTRGAPPLGGEDFFFCLSAPPTRKSFPGPCY